MRVQHLFGCVAQKENAFCRPLSVTCASRPGWKARKPYRSRGIDFRDLRVETCTVSVRECRQRCIAVPVVIRRAMPQDAPELVQMRWDDSIENGTAATQPGAEFAASFSKFVRGALARDH